jgi:V8-like Glu-specific endopeptidase
MYRLAALLILATGVHSSYATEKVVYGQDNRKDVFEVTNPLYLKLAKSTASLVSKSRLTKLHGAFYANRVQTLAQSRSTNVCSSENYADQPVLSHCSGFLVSPDTMVSAGHCYDTARSCKDSVWVFGYQMNNASSINLDMIQSKNVYECERVIKYKFAQGEDFSVIKLKRKVIGRAPLKFRKTGKISTRAKLLVIGSPSGLPLKIADGGTVLKNTGKFQFLTSLDTFKGNSGSPVFNSQTGLVEGILVSGKIDYVPTRSFDPNSCNVLNLCDQNGKNCSSERKIADGEGVTRMETIAKYIK